MKEGNKNEKEMEGSYGEEKNRRKEGDKKRGNIKGGKLVEQKEPVHKQRIGLEKQKKKEKEGTG